MNEPLSLRIADSGLRNEDNEITAGSATPPYLNPVVEPTTGRQHAAGSCEAMNKAKQMPRRGVRGLNLAWGSSSCRKLLSSFHFGLLLILCAMVEIAHAQDSDAFYQPPASNVSLPPESYTFTMKLPNGTDCSVNVKPQNVKIESKAKARSKRDAEQATPTMMMVERSFRKGISSSTETVSGSLGITFYFVAGMCGYESAREGVNVRRFLAGHVSSNVAIYHFPELTWAVPETRQPNPEVRSGESPRHLYSIADHNLSLEVDAITGRPVRFTDGQSEFTYEYKESASPIRLPEKIRAAMHNPVYE